MKEDNIDIVAAAANKGAHELAQEGLALFRQGKSAQAHRCFASAILMSPNNRSYKIGFAQCLPNIRYKQHNPTSQQAILSCLDDPGITHRKLSVGWVQQVEFDPAMSSLIALFNHIESYEHFKLALDVNHVLSALNNIFFCTGLKKCVLMHLKFEPLLIYLRRFYLLEATTDQQREALPFLCALSTKCFFNEYVFFVGDDKERQVQDWLKRDDLSVLEVVLLGCYYPLFKWSAAEKFIEKTHEKGVSDLVKLQITRPLEERYICNDIQSFSEIDDAVSNEVQSQYEEHPYPRWQHVSSPRFREFKREKSIGKDILVAGCGTGQESAMRAMQLPNAQIDAIDLSRTSLAYAIRQTRESGIDNINYLHGDLLHAEKLNKKYDLIFSSGVLHHMADPVAGLEALKRSLKPEGMLVIALYSETARQNIVTTQNWIVEQGYGSTAQEIRRFRNDIFKMPAGHPMKKMLYAGDFYNMSECRDLLFHVQEHRFDCLQLKSIIESQELVLLNFCSHIPHIRKKYKNEYPGDPLSINLDNWHAFEQRYPNSFLQMYDMVVGLKGAHILGQPPNWIKGLGIISDDE